MPTRVKITKQQMKQDKFTTFMLQSKDWFVERWQIIAIAAAIVVVVIVAIFYISNLKETRALEAANRLNTAISMLRQQQYGDALPELQQIADEYGGKIGARALFYLADGQYEGKNYGEAMAAFQRYIDKYGNDKIAAASAIAGIAACLENTFEYAAAGDKYIEAAEFYPESPSAPDYYLGAVSYTHLTLPTN